MKQEIIDQLKKAEEQMESEGDYAIVLAISSEGKDGHVFINGNSACLSQFMAHIIKKNEDFREMLEDAIDLAD